MHSIYIEPTDEITTVIERLKAAPEIAVALVIPKGATLIQSIVNLKLTKKVAGEAGKQIVIVSTDKIGHNLATQVGIPIVNTEKEATTALFEGTAAPDDAKVIAGVRIHRYYDEAEGGDGTEGSGQKDGVTPVEPIIIPKEITKKQEAPEEASGPATPAPIEIPPTVPGRDSETESVSTPTHRLADSSEKREAQSERHTEPEPNHEISRETGTTGHASTVDASEHVADSETERGDATETTSTPIENSITRSTMTPRVAQQNLPSNPRRKRALIITSVAVGALILAGVGASFTVFPHTTTSIHVKAESWSKELSFTADSSINNPNEDQTTIPAEVIKVEASDSLSVKATGSKDIGAAATGVATITNSTESLPQTLNKGAKLSVNGKTYTTTQDVTVSGAVFSGGKVSKTGTANVLIIADAAGPDSNQPSGTAATITSPSTALTATLTASGGTSEVVTVVSETDITTGKDALKKKLEDSVKAKLDDQIKNRELTYTADTETTTITDPSTSTQVGTQTDAFTVQGTAAIELFAVDTTILNNAAEKRSQVTVPANMTSHIKETKVQSFTLASSKKQATISTLTTGFQSVLISEDSIKSALKGKSFQKGQDILSSEVPSATFSTDWSPAWWPIKRYPYFSRWITINPSYDE